MTEQKTVLRSRSISAAPAPTLQKFYGSGSWLRVNLKSQLIKNSVMIFFLSIMKKNNDSFEWTEQKLKRNLNSLSYFEGYESVSFG